MRIVSLVPSATEILYRLGLADQIVGISHDCDYPADILDRPRLTSTTIGTDLSSYEIDRRVRESASSGHSLYAIQTELLESLNPDLIITQEQCSVCAVDRDRTVCALESAGFQTQLLSLASSDFSGLYIDILSIGSATGQTGPAEELVARLYQRVRHVIEQTALLDRPRVFCLSWFDPLMAAGGWINEMVRVAGGDPRLGGTSKASSRIDVRRIEGESPEIVFILPCSFSQERSAQEWIRIRDLSPWRDLPAVREGRVFTLESSLFHRPGPRLIDGVELLASLIHPARCSFSAASDLSQKVS